MNKHMSDMCGKKSGLWLLLAGIVFSICFSVYVPSIKVQATNGTSYESEELLVDLEEMFAGVKQQLKDAFEKVDRETAIEMFDFVKEKIADGSLKTDEGLSKAIEEGESRFGIIVDKETARQVVETMERLEDMGFSVEELVEKAKGLYEKYGAEFIEHANEAITEAVEEAAENAISNFFENLWEGAKNFFQSLISSF